MASEWKWRRLLHSAPFSFCFLLLLMVRLLCEHNSPQKRLQPSQRLSSKALRVTLPCCRSAGVDLSTRDSVQRRDLSLNLPLLLQEWTTMSPWNIWSRYTHRKLTSNRRLHRPTNKCKWCLGDCVHMEASIKTLLCTLVACVPIHSPPHRQKGRAQEVTVMDYCAARCVNQRQHYTPAWAREGSHEQYASPETRCQNLWHWPKIQNTPALLTCLHRQQLRPYIT